MIPALALLSKWKWIGLGLALLAAAIYVQTLRYNAASADARANKASADLLMHDLNLIAATNAANEELLKRTGAATAAAKVDATKAKAERDKAAADLREALNKASMDNANLAACFALELPNGMLNRLPWRSPSQRDGL